MPNVADYSDEGKWMEACVPKMVDEGRDQDQAVAACMSMWKDRGSKNLAEALADALKLGARNSGKDQQRLQMIHDYARDNGADCAPPDAGKSTAVSNTASNVGYITWGDSTTPTIFTPYVNAPYINSPTKGDETLITFGGSVKALGEGKVGGYLIRYSSATDPDLSGDYFTRDTDFGDAQKSDVYYQHGLDGKIGKRKIGKADLKYDEVGAWAEAQLNLRDEYEKAIYRLAQMGKLGWSSGTASHLVERQPDGKSQRITKWPLGLDASLTPNPAEPRNGVIPIKSYQPASIDLNPQPEAGQETRSAENEEEAKPDKQTSHQQESIKMAGEKEVEKEVKTEVKIEPPDDWKPAFTALKSEWDALKKEKPETKTFAVLTNGLGDSETKSLALYIRKGIIDPEGMKASNAVDMQYGNNAEGGYSVPLGFYNQIIARKSEMSLTDRLGLRPITGKGTTVNVPLDAEADGEFVATNEESSTDKDTPALGQAAMTLVKYTKRMLFSWELLEDEDANLLAFIADWIARGIAKTQNQLILTEVASGGTALKTYASATAIAAGELEGLVWNSNVTYYLDDGGSIAWVMRPSTYEAVSKLGSTSFRWYTPQVQGNSTPVMQPTLLGYPVYFSEKAAATAASAKDVYFGNWNYVGKREPSGLTLINDPYSNAATGQLTYHYYFRAVYKTLQAAAIGYGVHPSA